jgi:histidine ammonia-lyase
VSGGNFHAEPVAFAADQIALAIAEIGAIAQRRVALMVDPTLSFDLPPFPDARTGAEFRPDDRRSHHRGADEREQASRQSLLDRFSTPTSANQEDHVSWPPTARGGWPA